MANITENYEKIVTPYTLTVTPDEARITKSLCGCVMLSKNREETDFLYHMFDNLGITTLDTVGVIHFKESI